MNEIVSLLQNVRTELVAKYDELGLRASGAYERGLEIVSTPSRIRLESEEHVLAMENGVPAGTVVPPHVIVKWMRDKQLEYNELKEEEIAYLICRKIKRKGITVPNDYNRGGVVSGVLTPQRIDQLKKDIGDVLVNLVINKLTTQ